MFALWMLVASAFFALMGACIKLVANKVDFIDIIFFRSLFNMIIVLIIILTCRIGLLTSFFKLHLKRALIGNLAMYSGFYALIHLPIATATTLSYTNPIFQSVITIFTNKKQFNIKVFFSVIIGFAGILFLLHPDTYGIANIATGIGLLSGLLTALAYFNVGKLVRAGEPELRVVFYFSFVGTIIGGVLLIFYGFTNFDNKTFGAVCAIGLFGSLGQIAMTRAYGKGNAILVSIISYSTILFSTILGYLFFNEKISFISSIGIIFIVFSGIIAISKRSKNTLSKKTNDEITSSEPAPLH